MSNSFGTSHQYVGLNRVGKYMEPAREKGPGGAGVPPASHTGKHACGTPAPQNEKWRRITNIVGRNVETFTIKQRKRGIRALVKWMEQKCTVGSAHQMVGKAHRTILDDWGSDIEKWGGVKHAGRSVESLCVELGISHAKLSGLMKEGFGLSAGAIVDGIKVRGLKDFLIGQLREAARKLWGTPGSFAEVRCMLPRSAGVPPAVVAASSPPHPRCRRDAGDTAGRMPALQKRSRYFRTRAEEFFAVLGGDEVRMRISELLGALDQLREENDFGIQNLALRLGFASAAKFKKACWTVMGRSLEQLEKILAHEIVDYYLAAEDRKLREIALKNPGRQECLPSLIYCAREIYGSGDDAPEPPFLDRWSANEFAKPEWLSAMQEKFG